MLELMERREAADAALAAAREGQEKAAADRERAVQLRDDALADIADATARHEAARKEVAGRRPRPAAGALRPHPHADRRHRRGAAQGPAVPGLPHRAERAELAAVRNADAGRGRALRELRPRSSCAPPSPGCERRARLTRGHQGPKATTSQNSSGARGEPRWSSRRTADRGQPRAGRLRRAGARRRDRPGAGRAGRSRSGRATNNVAEYGGLVAGLQAALDLDPAAEVEVRMDSKLVVEQMSGRWKVKHPDMQKLALQAQQLARQLGGVRYTWVPRAQNGAADALANSAMDGKPVHRDAAAEPVVDRGRRPAAPNRPPVRHHADPPAAARAAPSTPRSVVTAAVTSCRCPRTGRAEAEAAAARARELGIEVVVASPLRRTRETAEIVAKALGVPVEFDDDLVELDFGDLEGLTFDEARGKHPLATRRFMADVTRGSPRRGVGRRRQRPRGPGPGAAAAPARRHDRARGQPRDPDQAAARRGAGDRGRARAPGVPRGGVASARWPGRPTAGARCGWSTTPPTSG